MPIELRCDQCQRVIPDPKTAWRCVLASRPFFEHHLHAACVPGFMAAHPLQPVDGATPSPS